MCMVWWLGFGLKPMVLMWVSNHVVLVLENFGLAFMVLCGCMHIDIVLSCLVLAVCFL